MNNNYTPEENAEPTYDSYTWLELKHAKFDNDALIEPYIPRVGISAIVGMPDSGKSMLCRNLVFSVAYGEETFLGLPLDAPHKRVLFVTTEDTAEATKYCFRKIDSSYSVKDPSIYDNDLHIILADDLTPEEIVERIKNKLEKEKFDLIIIDAYGDVFRGGEGNSNIQNRNSLRPFSNIAKDYRLAIIFVHHTNKAARNLSPDHIHVQGGSGFVQKIRTVLELRPSRENNSIKYLACTKGNGVADEFKKEALVLEFNPEDFRYYNTDKKIKISDLKIDQTPTAKGKIKVDEVFKSTEEELSRKDLVSRIMPLFEVSEKTAIRWIEDNLPSTNKRGMYANPKFALGQVTNPKENVG